MLHLLKKKLEKRKIKRTFREYQHTIKEFNLADEGIIHYAQWLNPLEGDNSITQSKVHFFNNFVNKGDFAIDIGAYTGDTTIPLALTIGIHGLVLALDPNPLVYKILEHNAQLNRDKTNIIPLCMAATQKDDYYYYNSSEATFNNGGISSDKKNIHGRYSLNNMVQGINLGKYLVKNFKSKLPKLSLIKIDTEGYDLEIIISILDILDTYRPSIIAEHFKKLKREKRYQLYDLFAQRKYDLYFFEHWEGKATHEWVKIDKPAMCKWKHFDFCALPQEKRESILDMVCHHDASSRH